MRTHSFVAEHAMRITFTLALVAAVCSVLMACHPAVVTGIAARPSDSTVRTVQSKPTPASISRAPAMKPVLAFDEKWVPSP